MLFAIWRTCLGLRVRGLLPASLSPEIGRYSTPSRQATTAAPVHSRCWRRVEAWWAALWVMGSLL